MLLEDKKLAELSQEEIGSLATEKEMSVEDFTTQCELEEQAQAEGRTVEEITAENDEIKGLMEKHGGDPKALAKALRSTTQGVTKKIEEEVGSRKKAEQQVQDVQAQLKNLETQKTVVSKEDAIDFLEKQFPNMDRETLKTIHEITQMQISFAVGQVQQSYADERIEEEKDKLKDDTFYKKYEKEINEQLKQLSPQQKGQRGMVKKVYDYVVGQHIEDIRKDILEEAKNLKPGEKKEILGQIKGSKPAASIIGKNTEGSLTAKQAEQAQRMGLTPASFLSVLKGRKETAKKNSKPEPELLTDRVT